MAMERDKAQSSKANSPIQETLELGSKVTKARLLQDEKQCTGISATDEGMEIEQSNWQS
jgi:hypothetical protein